MSFSNFFLISETLFNKDNDTAESSIFTSLKLSVTETADEAFINSSLSSDKQHVLYS